MAHLKKLYLGTSLDDLDKYTAIPEHRNLGMKTLLNTANKLLEVANERMRDGDEELVYITYVKYFNMLSIIRKRPDYSKNKSEVHKILGDNTDNRNAMDKLEIIYKSLSIRYKELETSKSRISSSNLSTSAQSISNDVINSLSAPEAYTKLGIISCEELYKRMQQKSVLVMDCRSSADYDASHLNYYCSFNVPEELITPGMSAGRLQARLSSKDKASWASRSVKESVVLMDWSTTEVQDGSSTPIAVLLDILQNWDPDVNYRAPLQILEGGYENFLIRYPTYCTNPSVSAPKINNNDNDAIDDIEYPSINDITMKEDIVIFDSKENQRPSINRANKPTTLRTQQNHLKQPQSTQVIEEIRDQHATLLQRAEENDRLLEDASKKWRRLHSAGASQSSEGQESLYNLLQLESESKDNRLENYRIRDRIMKLKEDEVLQDDNETTRQIEIKIAERQRLDEKHERDRLERERLLAIARETKPHYKPAVEPTIAPNDKSPPLSPIDEMQHRILNDQSIINSRPVYDRATKPRNESRAAVTETEASRIRDFSPVIGHNVGFGLTGLKNLGNTCYMNSILQCLSNTSHLQDFCVSNEYKKHISRQNKTNGQVIEEVAALIKELWNGQYKCVASRDLRYIVGQYQKTFRGVDQQDSHEFLTILMDWLHSDLQTIKVRRRANSELAWEKSWLEFTKSQESMILHLFYGQIKSTVKCVTCSKESATYECFSNLSMELPPNANLCQLNQCMDLYFSGEKIYGWNCPKCNTKRDAIKKLDISKLPPILVVHLKRFYADPSNSGGYVKKQNYVQFPLDNLEMKPYLARVESMSSTPKTFRLYAVSNHYGTMEGGHYTAFCKSAKYDRWFKFDDQVVSPLESSNVVSSAAYILFYTWLPPLKGTC
ncbi:ubiquitin carboxyl-terminal hydrolase 8 isoform X1 [Drosophila nasuta]|uniref:ubiquitin carboxyl-terminal hydrolase 8 isoform X1 n=1 Tax=Drosophila nasuta TaxID=42062 RepID=UPI00295E6514|nr:ubiquitin carboxyl-terminal hydrolase 8 isoform X1 [Drosophila nasuta]